MYLGVSIISFIFFANTTYYEASGTMLHLGMLKFMGEAKGVFDISYIKWYLILIVIILIGLFITINEIISKKIFMEFSTLPTYYIFGLLTSLLISILGILSINASYKTIYEDNKVISEEAKINEGKTIVNFYTKYLRSSSFDNFGIMSFYVSNYNINYKNADCGEEINGIEEDKNEDNEFHGLLEGYNIFTIMVETGISEMITKEYTPNLYYLMSNGINFNNNYSKDKTSSAEIIGFTGSYPIDGINYDYNYNSDTSVYKLKINTPYAITNILGDSYFKSFFHDGVGYYARNSLIGQFGFDSWRHEFYNVHNDNVDSWEFIGNYELDSDYVDIVLDDMYKKNQQFYTFYTTLSTHGPYEDYTGNTEVKERDALFKELGYTDKFLKYYDEVYGCKYPNISNKFYKYLMHLTCAFMNLDEAIGKIINRLKEEGIFDKTIFVVYGDHDAYYHQSATNPGLSRILTNSDSVDDVRQYKTALFFYNETLTNKYKEVYDIPKNENINISSFTSPYIIVPTLLDLLGYDYDTKYYYSVSYFDFKTEYDGLFYSTELGAFFNDLIYSPSPGIYTYKSNKLSNGDLDAIEIIENKKLLKLKTINDYYKNWFYFEDKK